MTDHTPTPGNAPGLPAPTALGDICAQLDRLERKSTRLAGVLNAIAALWPEHQCSEGTAALVFLSEELAGELNRDLDALCVQASTFAFDHHKRDSDNLSGGQAA